MCVCGVEQAREAVQAHARELEAQAEACDPSQQPRMLTAFWVRDSRFQVLYTKSCAHVSTNQIKESRTLSVIRNPTLKRLNHALLSLKCLDPRIGRKIPAMWHSHKPILKTGYFGLQSYSLRGCSAEAARLEMESKNRELQARMDLGLQKTEL